MFLLQYGNATGNADLTLFVSICGCVRERVRSQTEQRKHIYMYECTMHSDTNEELVVGSATKKGSAEFVEIFFTPRRSDVYST